MISSIPVSLEQWIFRLFNFEIMNFRRGTSDKQDFAMLHNSSIFGNALCPFWKVPMIYFTKQMIFCTKKVPITKSSLKAFMVSSLTQISDANLRLLRLEYVQTVNGTNINTHVQWIFWIFKLEIMNFLFDMQNT